LATKKKTTKKKTEPKVGEEVKGLGEYKGKGMFVKK